MGCRTLIYRNFSRILSGIYNDIVDWVAGTRVKSSQLLYTLMINEEDNVTQHLEKVLSCLQRAAGDDQEEVMDYVSVLNHIFEHNRISYTIGLGFIMKI